jgi:hypothetical protein
MTRPLKGLTPVEEMEKMCASLPLQGAVSLIPGSRSVWAVRLGPGTTFRPRESMVRDYCCDKEVP